MTSAPTPSGATPPGATHDGQSALLQVQEHDTLMDQLRHRRATMAPKGELAQVTAALNALLARSAEIRGQRDELAGRQQALEEQIEQTRNRRGALEQRLFGGTVSASRDLQAMDEEVRHLARHISELEDREIELMEAIEPLDGELQAADVERDALAGESSRLRQAIAEAEAAIDADLALQEEARREAAGRVPPALLERYESLRSRLGGTGAARLVGSSCSGCHLTLPSMEVDRIRHAGADEIFTCEQCGRILVR